mmetsp:Transcript_35145/g.88436  ORF Transcript_35145/g.88436 Transcript_35145/m.88436 type:complete len:179 (-) Transcript_35145:78-614(-)
MTAARTYLLDLLDLYMRYLNVKPVLTNAVTHCVLDSAEVLLAAEDHPRKLRRAAAMAFYGFSVSGPLSFYLHRLLATRVHTPSHVSTAILRVVLANVCIVPVQLAVFLFVTHTVMSDKDWYTGTIEIRRRLMRALLSIWNTLPFVHLFAFTCLPPPAWAPFISLAMMVWSIRKGLLRG